MDCTATIIGIPNIPTITEVNVRSDNSVKSAKKFTVPIGLSGLNVQEVKPDREGTKQNGKVYQWFRLAFPGGSDGWVRDDLITIAGDCAEIGYTNGLADTKAFDLTYAEPKSDEPAVPIPSVPSTPATTSPANITVEPTVKRFEASGRVRIRSNPSLRGDHLGWVDATTIIDVDPESSTTADGYVWWKHVLGWSAEKSIDETQLYLEAPIVVGGPIVPISSRDGFDDHDRLKLASYAITGAFEGSGYAAYNNYDAGIISYGLIQFTMAAGSMITVVQRYLAESQTDVANQLREYLPRIEARDNTLRQDSNLKNLLIAAADEQVMKDAQHSVADEKYWDKVWSGYVAPRNLETPLGIALLFDMGVNFGTGHAFARLAEQQLGVPPRSKPGQNGIVEEQLIQRIAELRKASHDKQAREQGFYGLMKRGNFWMRLINRGDWGLQGDANGNVRVNNKIVHVRNP